MKKKNKKMIIISSVVALIILMIIVLILNVVNDKKKSNKNMQLIKYNYDELSVAVTEYNQIRTDLNELLNNFIYEDYPNKHSSYIELLNKYNNNIDKIDDYVEVINNKCNVIYSDITINKICDSYDMLYEKLINLYVQDLNNYNNKITSYNEYKKENIELFNLIHKDYIDYNKDNTYEGRISENETEA